MTKVQCWCFCFGLRRDAVTALAVVVSVLAAAMLVRAGLLMAFGLGFAALWAVWVWVEFSLALSGQSAIFITMGF